MLCGAFPETFRNSFARTSFIAYFKNLRWERDCITLKPEEAAFKPDLYLSWFLKRI